MRVEKERMQQHNECTQRKNAAAAIYDRFASSIFAYARLYTPLWEDAEDVTLEVFTAALERNSLIADFDELLPEEADEQNQRLMHDLRRIYRTDTQTVEHLAHMRQRLLANDDSSAYDHESTQQHYTPPTLQQVQSSTR